MLQHDDDDGDDDEHNKHADNYACVYQIHFLSSREGDTLFESDVTFFLCGFPSM